MRTAAEGASEEELAQDVARLQEQWESIESKAKSAAAPALLYGEPDLTVKVVRDLFNEDVARVVVQGDDAWATIEEYVLGAHVNFNFFYSPLHRRLELLGTDTRRQTNISGLANVPAPFGSLNGVV